MNDVLDARDGTSRRLARIASLGAAFSLAALDGRVRAAPEVLTGWIDGPVTTDPCDVRQGGQVSASTSPMQGGFDPRDLIGGNFGVTEGGGKIILNDALTTGRVVFRAMEPFVLTGYRIFIQNSAPPDRRSTESYVLEASLDGITYATLGATNGLPSAENVYTIRHTGLSQGVQFFRLALTKRANCNQGRVQEFDADGRSQRGRQWLADPLAFNSEANTLNAPRGEEAAGYARNIVASSVVTAGFVVQDAFGGSDGTVEPGVFIFANATADNGDAVMGNGKETVHWITWQTARPLKLAGYEVTLEYPDRPTQLVRFSAGPAPETLTVLDFFDNDGGAGTVRRIFAQPVVASAFKIEMTSSRSMSSRVFEINAILDTARRGSLVLVQ